MQEIKLSIEIQRIHSFDDNTNEHVNHAIDDRRFHLEAIVESQIILRHHPRSVYSKWINAIILLGQYL